MNADKLVVGRKYVFNHIIKNSVHNGHVLTLLGEASDSGGIYYDAVFEDGSKGWVLPSELTPLVPELELDDIEVDEAYVFNVDNSAVADNPFEGQVCVARKVEYNNNLYHPVLVVFADDTELYVSPKELTRFV